MGFTDNYFSFQGKLYLAKRSSAGVNQAFRFLGNVPAGSLELNVDRRKHQESTSGKRLVDKVQTTTKGGRVKLTLEDIQKKNVALVFAGANVALASGSLSGSNYDTFASGLVVGDIVKLQRPNASSIVVKDSAGSPATLVLNTDYKIIDADHGLIEILSLGSYTQPFRAQYAYAATDAVTAFEAGDDEEYFLYCALVNTEANPDQALGIEIYRIVFDPAAATQLINNEQGSFEIEGEVLRDSTRADDANFGGFFRWLYTDANA